jgi:hypothetical protein
MHFTLPKTRPNIVFLILIFLLLYSNYTQTTLVYDHRIIFCTVLVLMLLIRIFTIKNTLVLRLIDIPTLLIVFTYSLLTILDLFKGLYASSLGCLMFVLIVLVINTFLFEKLFKQIEILNVVNNYLSLLFIILVLFFVDTRIRNVFGISIPLFLSYTIQPSLIPALIMLPFAIYLLFSPKYKNTFFILVTCVICFSGSVYFAVLIAILLYYIINRFSKILFVVFPFLLMLTFSLSISIAGNTLRKKSIELRSEAYASNKGVLDWAFERLISGTERLAFYNDQIITTKKNILFGSKSAFDNQSLGSLIMKFGIRGGILALLAMSLFFGYLMLELYKYNKRFPDKRVGVVLLYSLIIQAMIYNEMGFYSHYSIAIFFISYSLLRAKNSEIRSDTYSVKNLSVKV